MAKTSIWDIKEELVVFLRNADLISTSVRGVTTSQDTGTFAGANTHTLAINPTLVKNVRNITVASILLVFGTDYTVNMTTGVISFTSPQTGAYVINYDQGSTDKIYPDFPQPHLKLSSFPRIAFDIISGDTTEMELGAGSNWTEYLISVVAYDKDQDDVEALIASIRSALMDAKKSFYYITFITPTAMGPLIVSPFGKDKIMQRNQDFLIRFIYEN